MNEPATKTPTQVGAIQEEHAELLCLADQLCAACYPSSRDRDTVQDTSQTLAAELVEHFALEERGGYFADALERAPQLEQFAHELQTQHEGLLESVEALNKLARSGVESDAWWRKIEADVASLTSRLRKHEAGERELLQRAYGEDIGTKDQPSPVGPTPFAAPLGGAANGTRVADASRLARRSGSARSTG